MKITYDIKEYGQIKVVGSIPVIGSAIKFDIDAADLWSIGFTKAETDQILWRTYNVDSICQHVIAHGQSNSNLLVSHDECTVHLSPIIP